MKKKGKFIVFEGVGGCGKGVQVKFVKKLLKRNRIKVIATREPGGIKSSEVIRQLIFDLRGQKLIGSEGQMVLFYAARKFWVDKVVNPSLKKRINVIADRSYTATGAYQGYAEGGDQNIILKISDVVMGQAKPDAVILLDVSVETSMERRKDTKGDPFDKEDKKYFQKIINGYREMAREKWGGLKWYVVDGEPSIKEVLESVAKVFEKIFSRKLNRL
ncbi:MAG: dTMP kinase [Candidatus Woesebacteria bacterium]|nr:dTMP kinase [Candidatus Woesebacteria bacterium]